jgi:hypothetical protein
VFASPAVVVLRITVFTQLYNAEIVLFEAHSATPTRLVDAAAAVLRAVRGNSEARVLASCDRRVSR